GTISDSATKIVNCMQAAARQVSMPVCSSEAIKNIIGLGLPEALAALYPTADEQEKARVQRAYSEQFMSQDTTPSPFFQGARETMQQLKAQGHFIAVATGKSHRGLQRVLNLLAMEDFFDATRCADQTASKPNPLMLCELLREFSCDAADAVMVGDTEYDMAMAQAIDMPRIAVSYGAHHIDRLRPYQPLLCVDKFAQILECSALQVAPGA
nr:HAD-IA family hydrolase [Cellvibrionaceae bacterium]